jgi:chloramphenicol O-acetyltransferase type B
MIIVVIKYLLKYPILIRFKTKRLFYTTIVKMKVKKVGQNLRANEKCRISSNTILGDNVNFNGMTIEGKGVVKIGNNFHSGRKCLMITDIHNYDHGIAIPYDDTYIIKNIVIEDNVWIGTNVIILGGVTIGEGAIIQAGSVVVANVQKYGIAGGSPAKVFKIRDIEHYEKLKSEKKYT